MYADMVTARYYEERLQEEYLEGKQPAFDISAGPIPGELHLAAGQEAAAAGVCQHLRDDDTVTAPHRPHHVAIAKGVDLERMTAEIFGREAGLGEGKGGHMHLFDPDVNFACSGIIAEGCPPAVGAGLAAKKRNTDSVAVAYLGEGAIDQGGFLESLNLAAVHDLPVVFVVEDNDWAISMPKERVTDVERASQRADGFDIRGVSVDHDDAVAVYEAAGEAVGRARDQNGPTVLAIQVHRRMGHFMGDPQSYRSEEDQAAATERDSIERLAADLRAAGVDDSDLTAIRETAHERVDDAIEWAKEQPKPDPDAAYEDAFTNPPSGVTDTEPEFDLAGGEGQ
ncbi:MAG: thiamine pyrophosphate-dependent dehydrogenase E1 component subunit alpha [Haloplanus sp.]